MKGLNSTGALPRQTNYTTSKIAATEEKRKYPDYKKIKPEGEFCLPAFFSFSVVVSIAKEAGGQISIAAWVPAKRDPFTNVG